MYRKKIYGQSRAYTCPICKGAAVTQNEQGIPVCVKHKETELNLKCVCGGWLDVRNGKWGPYFFCLNCGNISFQKGLDMSGITLNK